MEPGYFFTKDWQIVGPFILGGVAIIGCVVWLVLGLIKQQMDKED